MTVLGNVEPFVLGTVSQSTGSIIVDTAIGGVVGYALAPDRAKLRYAVGGGLATGLGGVLGLAGTVAFIFATKAD
jgi:hypothetical protein